MANIHTATLDYERWFSKHTKAVRLTKEKQRGGLSAPLCCFFLALTNPCR